MTIKVYVIALCSHSSAKLAMLHESNVDEKGECHMSGQREGKNTHHAAALVVAF